LFWLGLCSSLGVHSSNTETRSYSFRLSVVSLAHLAWLVGS
jgi:hypothetical protein